MMTSISNPADYFLPQRLCRAKPDTAADRIRFVPRRSSVRRLFMRDPPAARRSDNRAHHVVAAPPTPSVRQPRLRRRGLYDGARGPFVLGVPSDRVSGAGGQRVLYRILPRAGRLVVLRRLRCSVDAVEGAGVLWLADRCTHRVYGIDPRTGRTRTRFVAVPLELASLTFSRGALWIVSYRCGLRRIDPARMRVVATLCMPGFLLASGTTWPWFLSWGEVLATRR